MANCKIFPPRESTNFKKLDPHTLGRPFHLLRTWSDLFHLDLAHYFRVKFNQRYRSSYLVEAITPHAQAPNGTHWNVYELEEVGQIAVSFDHPLLVDLLEYRYGKRDLSTEQTETELRLSRRLSEDVARVTMMRIADQTVQARSPSFQPTPSRSYPDVFTVCAKLRNGEHTGSLWISLDASVLNRLLGVYAPKPASTTKRLGTRISLASHLHFSLKARLCCQEITLDSLLSLHVGDIIPARIAPEADILIGDAHLLTATVAEHKGKLFLTSFQPRE